jgi:lipooligosaccharide transport system permease protein
LTTTRSLYARPVVSRRFVPIWQRNALVWRKLAGASLLSNLVEPLIYLVGLGYGLGAMVGSVNGMPYIMFLAAGSLCSSTMTAATFEAFYSAFSRMQVQKTWEAIMNAPVHLEDLVLGELTWAASKATLSGLAIFVVAWALGFVTSPLALWVLPLIPLIGVTFGATALIVTALAPGYDAFVYYFTGVLTPMLFLSGVFFPIEQLPPFAQAVAHVFPLVHAVELVRPLMTGATPAQPVLHLAVMLGYALAGFYIAVVLFRRRLRN